MNNGTSIFHPPFTKMPQVLRSDLVDFMGVQPATHGATIMRLHVTGLFTTKNH